MEEQICLVVYGNPIAQKRHRTFNAGPGRGDKFGNMHVDPSKSKKSDLLWMIQERRPAKPFEGALRVDTAFFFPRPKSHFGTGKNSEVLKANAPEWYTNKPDRDNLDKFVLDSMKGVFWKDDAIVCSGEITKKYSDNPRTEITITIL